MVPPSPSAPLQASLTARHDSGSCQRRGLGRQQGPPVLAGRGPMPMHASAPPTGGTTTRSLTTFRGPCPNSGVPTTDWSHFTTQLCHTSGSSAARSDGTKKKLDQQTRETYALHVEDLLALCRRVNRDMPEADRVCLITKRINHFACTALALQNPPTVATVTMICQRLGELRDHASPRAPVAHPQQLFRRFRHAQRPLGDPPCGSHSPCQAWRPRRQDSAAGRPVCYYCGIRGHVSRLCRQCQKDERRVATNHTSATTSDCTLFPGQETALSVSSHRIAEGNMLLAPTGKFFVKALSVFLVDLPISPL